MHEFASHKEKLKYKQTKQHRFKVKGMNRAGLHQGFPSSQSKIKYIITTHLNHEYCKVWNSRVLLSAQLKVKTH